MLRQVKEQSGQKPKIVLADNGYLSEPNLHGTTRMQVDLYVATGKQKHNQVVSPCARSDSEDGHAAGTYAGQAANHCRAKNLCPAQDDH